MAQCWCGDDSIVLRHGAGVCDFDCAGDSSIKCGGFDAFTLYDLEDAASSDSRDPVSADDPSSPTDDNYLGCYADDQNNRVLDGATTTSSSMTSAVRTIPVPENVVVH